MSNKAHKVTPVLAAVSALTMASAGCTSLDSPAETASYEITDAATRELLRQVCAPVSDGRISASELNVLSSIVGAVDGGGLPEPVMESLRGLTKAGTPAPEDIQDSLQSACRDAGA